MNYSEAKDRIYKQVTDCLDSGAAAIIGEVPDIRYKGLEKPGLPDQSKYWVRVSTQEVDTQQTSLRNDNSKRYTSDGLVFVQFFSPKSDSLGVTNGEELAKLVRNCLRANLPDCSLVFRNARIRELDPEKNWTRFNVIAEFEYDEIV